MDETVSARPVKRPRHMSDGMSRPPSPAAESDVTSTSSLAQSETSVLHMSLDFEETPPQAPSDLDESLPATFDYQSAEVESNSDTEEPSQTNVAVADPRYLAVYETPDAKVEEAQDRQLVTDLMMILQPKSSGMSLLGPKDHDLAVAAALRVIKRRRDFGWTQWPKSSDFLDRFIHDKRHERGIVHWPLFDPMEHSILHYRVTDSDQRCPVCGDREISTRPLDQTGPNVSTCDKGMHSFVTWTGLQSWKDEID